MEFMNAKPFPHLVIDNFLEINFANKIAEEFPEEEWYGWYSYNNPLEKKKSCNNLDMLPENINKYFGYVNSQKFIQRIEELTGISNLEADPHLHGGGAHYHPAGGKLHMHLDYSIHPISGKERRLNLILYLNQDWQRGGELELWDPDLQHCVKKVEPIFNRAVLFQTSDISWHGLPTPCKSPRKSLAVFYLSEPRPNVTPRYKAKFAVTPADTQKEYLQKLIDIRSTRRLTDEDLL